ncbi:iron ABC transporter permease [Leuconostoc holzapfelii]|nr:iron ABC transporter permease [Leuconostoc holzapfelii]
MRKISYGVIFLGLIVVAALTLGVPLGGQWPTRLIVWQLRLPRLLFALLGGAMIAVSAVIFQTTLRQRYLDGSMLGLASGSELGIALWTLCWPKAHTYRVFLGAGLAILLLWLLRQRILKNMAMSTVLPLAGLGMAMFLNAGTSLLTNQQGLLGQSLANVTITDAWSLGIVALIGVLMIQTDQAQLTFFALPQWHVAQLGVNEQRLSWFWQVVAAGYLGAVTAVLGTIFFVGLVLAQVVVRWWGGNAQARLLPTALIGAVMLSVSDFFAHSLRYPVELPTGAMFMFMTAPFLMFILWGYHAD